MHVTDDHIKQLVKTRMGHYYLVGYFTASIIGMFIYCYKRSKKLKALAISKNYYLNWLGFAAYLVLGMGVIEKRLNQKVKEDISEILIDLNFAEELNPSKKTAEELYKTRKLIHNQIKHYKNFNLQTSMMKNLSLKV